MTEKFAALKSGDWLDFIGNKNPKCPHCGHDYDIQHNEAWHLYDENGPHDLECWFCEEQFKVSSSASWSFSTDEQEDAE
ncbi:hypothetical protein [Rhizobium lentis]|uniref:Uncharacterized protein n=1 Tax=Rhizobium lentis TaxID=1138194 RepID=A0ABS7IBX4_9HYPH|nr:hypothetical protein [Rhizobium lentis]MBX5089392.1 hypothetical protein [Rhizobium lentis]